MSDLRVCYRLLVRFMFSNDIHFLDLQWLSAFASLLFSFGSVVTISGRCGWEAKTLTKDLFGNACVCQVGVWRGGRHTRPAPATERQKVQMACGSTWHPAAHSHAFSRAFKPQDHTVNHLHESSINSITEHRDSWSATCSVCKSQFLSRINYTLWHHS